MPVDDRSSNPRGVVVAHAPDDQEHASEHERSSLLAFAHRLAALRDYDFGGIYEPLRRYPGHRYFVPSRTLTRAEAAVLGIRGRDDLFGGVVPYAFVATKAISHPLLADHAAAPPGWDPGFAVRAGDAVLAGYTAFEPGDACQAGLRLLASGPVRIKPVRATGGHGQSVARDAPQLQRLLAASDPGEIAAHGLVLEEDLSEVRTVSVGQVTVADLTASYFGFQRLTRNNHGDEVFGGSDLTVVRGGWDELLGLAPAPGIRRAIEQARRYDAAVNACFAGFFASRINYDIVPRARRGRPCALGRAGTVLAGRRRDRPRDRRARGFPP